MAHIKSWLQWNKTEMNLMGLIKNLIQPPLS